MKPALLFTVAALLVAVAQAQIKVQDRSLYRRNNTNLIVTFTDSLTSVYRSVNSRRFSTRGSRIQAMKRGLEAATRRTQTPVIRGLRPFGVEARSFWVSNQMAISGANPRVITYLAGLSSVKSIREDRKTRLAPVRRRRSQAPTAPEWGVERIQAPDLWERTMGEGVKVGIIDTGVRSTHEALRENFVGIEENGWYDAVHQAPEPEDNDGHGTHCAGVSTGRNGIGVAPRAQWMACRACDVEDGGVACADSWLLACGQFMLCPTQPDGSEENCDMAPEVVSNSWGGGQGDDFFNDVIQSWEEAGIFSAFAVGNEGPNCDTAGSPGDQIDTFSVGATDRDDRVADFSSRGPGDGPFIKPTVVAPGVRIRSCVSSSDTAYEQLDGTSMATPHAAGAAALLKSLNMDASPQQIRNALTSTCFQDLKLTGQNCGGTNETEYPNNIAGWGLIQVDDAADKLLS